MSAININHTLVETYLALLKNLSPDDKLELIALLSQSMKVQQPIEPTFKALFGAFQSDKSAEQQIEEIRQSRVFNRKIEEF
ncbi:MAG: hypothetical protein JNK77_07045 [Saprospiraceae bacterium]|jgi:hypothetical protein|nr:hypothetical protein [Saprospiraceae bacterium]NUQ24712.1 hypothetical protein [Saprospiraceae bacterium]